MHAWMAFAAQLLLAQPVLSLHLIVGLWSQAVLLSKCDGRATDHGPRCENERTS